MADVRRILRGSFLENRSDLFVAVGVIVVVGMLIIPLPTVLLDLLMAINLVFSLIIILDRSLYDKGPGFLDFPYPSSRFDGIRSRFECEFNQAHSFERSGV